MEHPTDILDRALGNEAGKGLLQVTFQLAEVAIPQSSIC